MVFHATRAFRASLLALVLLQFLALQQNALAQVAGGTISRTVTDANGNVIPNAEITITNVETGIGRNAITNEVGIYITPNLLPGRYGVRFSAAGFKTQVRTGIALNVGTDEVVDLAMQVGASTETVEVTTEAPADLATLQPGVNAIQTQPTFAAGTAAWQRWATHDYCRGCKESRERCLFLLRDQATLLPQLTLRRRYRG